MIDYNSFAGKLRNSETNTTVSKMNASYNFGDTRCWSAVVNPGTDNIIVTFNVNRYELGTKYFDVFSSNKILSDIDAEDIYDVLELIISKNSTFTNQPLSLEKNV